MREREEHSSPKELHALVPFPLPKMSCMLLFFPPSQRELNNSAACAQQHALSSLPLSKENLTKPQLHVPSLGVREKGEGEGRLNNQNHGKKTSLGPAGNSQQKKKGRKPRLEGRTIPPRPAQRLSKNVRYDQYPSLGWLLPQISDKKEREENSKMKGVVFFHLNSRNLD